MIAKKKKIVVFVNNKKGDYKMLLKEKNIKDMTIQIFHSCIAISDIIGDRIIIKRYVGYTEKEAISLFINENYKYEIIR